MFSVAVLCDRMLKWPIVCIIFSDFEFLVVYSSFSSALHFKLKVLCWVVSGGVGSSLQVLLWR